MAWTCQVDSVCFVSRHIQDRTERWHVCVDEEILNFDRNKQMVQDGKKTKHNK